MYTFLIADRLSKLSSMLSANKTPLVLPVRELFSLAHYSQTKEGETSPNHILFVPFKDCILSLNAPVMPQLQLSVGPSKVLCKAMIQMRTSTPMESYCLHVEKSTCFLSRLMFFLMGQIVLTLSIATISYLSFLTLPWGESLRRFSNLSNNGVFYLTSSFIKKRESHIECFFNAYFIY